MFFFYQVILTLIIAISPIIILIRIFKNKENVKRYKEKFIISSKKIIKGKKQT